jgi:paraquat-inducible protein A
MMSNTTHSHRAGSSTQGSQTLDDYYPSARWRVKLQLIFALLLLLVGLFAPLLTLEKFFIFSNTVSLMSGLLDLISRGYILLFVLIFGFSVLLPSLKILMIYKMWKTSSPTDDRDTRYLHWMSQLSKWSMLDVFVVALLIVSVKIGAIAKVDVHYGLYCFAASVLLTTLTTSDVLRLHRRWRAAR